MHTVCNPPCSAAVINPLQCTSTCLIHWPKKDRFLHLGGLHSFFRPSMNWNCNDVRLQSTEEFAHLNQLWASLARSMPFFPCLSQKREQKQSQMPFPILASSQIKIQLIRLTYILALCPSALIFLLGIATVLLTYILLTCCMD